MNGPRGFTLIELMVVVAIIGILASIAIPSFHSMMLRTKRSELPTNVNAIATAERAYHMEWDTFTQVGACHTEWGNRRKAHNWNSCGNVVAWENLGYLPDGETYGIYYTPPPVDHINVAVWGFTDLDEDGVSQGYRWAPAGNVEMMFENNIY